MHCTTAASLEMSDEPNISCEGAFSRFVGPVIDKVLGLRCTSLAISTARLWVLCQVSTSVAATVWRM